MLHREVRALYTHLSTNLKKKKKKHDSGCVGATCANCSVDCFFCACVFSLLFFAEEPGVGFLSHSAAKIHKRKCVLMCVSLCLIRKKEELVKV